MGTEAAVPALGALLTDEKLAQYARHALEPMSSPAAGAALRDALGRVQGGLLVGIINSLGVRRDREATAALAGRLADANGKEEIVSAAAVCPFPSLDTSRPAGST